MARYVVKRKRSAMSVIIIAAVVVAVMALTNPTLTDLENHVRNSAEAEARKQAGEGAFGNLISGIAKGGAGFVAKNFYARLNIVIFSTFEPRSGHNPRYIGLFKFLFIKA